MAKKEIDKELMELKKEMGAGNLVIGMKTVLRGLKKGLLKKIYLASNCAEEAKRDIEYYAKLEKVPITSLAVDNEELGVLCKKHFFISVLGVKQ